MARFDGTVTLVTGGARGIGAANAKALVDEGGNVVVGDILDEEGEALAAELGDAATYIHLDVTSSDDWQAAVDCAEQSYGPVSVLINNAGIVSFGPVAETDPDAFRRVIDINLTGVFLGMHHTIPSLRRAGGGVIVNISSTAGMMGYANLGAYVSSKWGVRGLTKTAALELGGDGIRVFSVHPGPIATPMTAGIDTEGVTSTQPIPRVGQTDEVAKMVLFLAADATYSTGSEFVVDGGALLGPVLALPSE